MKRFLEKVYGCLLDLLVVFYHDSLISLNPQNLVPSIVNLSCPMEKLSILISLFHPFKYGILLKDSSNARKLI